MNSKKLGALFICCSAVLWGLDGVVLTPRLTNLPVPFVVFLLHAVPFLLMAPILRKKFADLVALDRRGVLTLFLVAVFGGFLGTFALVKALFLVNFDQLSVVVLLQKLQPVFAIVLAAIVLKEPLSPSFLRWSGLAIVGAVALTFGLQVPHLAPLGATGRAAFWAVLAAVAFASATVLGKLLLTKVDFKTATLGRYGITTLITLVYLLGSGSGLPLATVTTSNWILVVIIGLTTGSGAIFLYYYGLTRVRATTATICELSLPLTAVVLDYVVNRSVLDPIQWVGGIFMITAIAKVTSGQGRSEDEETNEPASS